MSETAFPTALYQFSSTALVLAPSAAYYIAQNFHLGTELASQVQLYFHHSSDEQAKNTGQAAMIFGQTVYSRSQKNINMIGSNVSRLARCASAGFAGTIIFRLVTGERKTRNLREYFIRHDDVEINSKTGLELVTPTQIRLPTSPRQLASRQAIHACLVYWLVYTGLKLKVSLAAKRMKFLRALEGWPG